MYLLKDNLPNRHVYAQYNLKVPKYWEAGILNVSQHLVFKKYKFLLYFKHIIPLNINISNVNKNIIFTKLYIFI